MSILLPGNPAPRGNFAPSRWTRGNKDAVGSSASPCPVWFTLTGGVVSEVYFPRIDMPQIRDVQLLVTDGKSFFHDGWRSYDVHYETIAPGVPGYVMTCTAKDQPYQIVYEIITAARTSCLLIRTRIQVLSQHLPVFCNPCMRTCSLRRILTDNRTQQRLCRSNRLWQSTIGQSRR